MTQIQTAKANPIPNWQQRLDAIYDVVKEMSLQTHPQEMVQAYARRMARIFPVDRRISLSRRGLRCPAFRVTRYSEWQEEINPWKQADRLPLLRGGFFADLLYGDVPQIFDELDVPDDDPAAPYLQGQRSAMAIPMLDQGQALNMVILTREQPAAFDRERFPDDVWLANLFGRATHNLVLSEQVREAYEEVDRELKTVAAIQQSLLPRQLPDIPRLSLAAYYQTSRRAGGDYYDFFPLPSGKWGLLIADVSGHGIPAAVMMAVTHSIAHLYPEESGDPGDMLSFVNWHLASRYTNGFEAFVTAFYGIFDPETLQLEYASAGHNPPRWIRCGTSEAGSLDKAVNVPLGVGDSTRYESSVITLSPGDLLVLYTDGITETMNEEGGQFGPSRLDQYLTESCRFSPQSIVSHIVQGVEAFAVSEPYRDDRTLVVARVK